MVRIGPENSLSDHAKKFSPREHARRELWAKMMESSAVFVREHDALENSIKALNIQRQQLIDSEQDLTSIDEKLRCLKAETDKETFMKKRNPSYDYDISSKQNEIILNCNIVCTTINSCANRSIRDAIRGAKDNSFYFTCCIMDEATQCHEIEAVTPLQLGIQRFVLVGDPNQLSATITNSTAKRCNFGKSLFTRIVNNFSNSKVMPIPTLTTQYRMCPEIISFPNKKFYQGVLRTEFTNKNKIVPSIAPYLVFNLDRRDCVVQYHSTDEISFVKTLIEVITATISKDIKYSIGVITPYRAQRDALRKALPPYGYNNVSIGVNTVDSFQGQERDIVIISYVKNNSTYFLNDSQRINVALTRAKQALFIVGTYDLFKNSSILYDVREDAKSRYVCRDIKNMEVYYNRMRKDLFGAL